MNDPDFLEALKRHLPRVPGIHAKEEYFNSVVLLPLVRLDGEYHLLFEKRSPDIRQGGEVCFPGGEYDPDKDAGLRETALRETVEETGISLDRIEIIGVLDTMVHPTGMTVDAFVAVVHLSSLKELALNPAEVEYVFTVPVSWFLHHPPEVYHADMELHPSCTDEATGREVVLLPARELGLPEKYTKPWGGRRFRILVYRTPRDLVWGITARLVWDLTKRIPAHHCRPAAKPPGNV
ncbi:MAG: CoA pyrophosphatase [Peptococcaceae bacterium]|nr:CoA pyrophosphatase [Peptococcaceae bacterium]